MYDLLKSVSNMSWSLAILKLQYSELQAVWLKHITTIATAVIPHDMYRIEWTVDTTQEYTEYMPLKKRQMLSISLERWSLKISRYESDSGIF